jgi:predicted AlkP superfamily pyrophosphatase or phosphodiesterase
MIGVDGLEPDVVEELFAAGLMPNLAAIAERGVLGELETLTPTYSPVIWTTIATGQDMEAHGIVDFLDQESGQSFTSNCRKVPAIWELVSTAGRTVDVTGWWVSWPAEAVNGRVVASYAAGAQYHVVWKGNLWKDLSEQTFPPALADEIEPLALWAQEGDALQERFWEVYPRPARPLEPQTMRARLVQDLMWTFAGDESFARIAEHFLEGEPGDLSMVYLATPDVAGHRFWRYHAPEDFPYEVPAEDVAELGDYLRLTYRMIDDKIGRLVAAAPPNTTVIVLSDHGMYADPENRTNPESINSGHHQLVPPAPGVFAAAGPRVKRLGVLLGDARRKTVGGVLGVAPLVLHLLDVPVPNHWPQAQSAANPLEAILDDSWRAEHPPRPGPNPESTYRKATAPRIPAGVDADAYLQVLRNMGYVDE